MVATPRLLLWYWGRRGGGARYTIELARALQPRSDIDLQISYSKQNELGSELEQLDIPSYPIDTFGDVSTFLFGSARLPTLRNAFSHWLHQQQVDVVYSTMSHVWTPFTVRGVKRSGARLIVGAHDASAHPGDDLPLRDWLIRREIRAADRVICHTKSVAGQVARQHNVAEELISVVPLGNHVQQTDPRTGRHHRGASTRLLFFGRILPYKGLPLLLGAFELVQSAHPAALLMIVGQGKVDLSTCSARARDAIHVENRWIPDAELRHWFDQADVLVAPYIEASQSGVIPSALAHGIPVVATPVGGLVEQVAHEQTGLLAASVSAEAVAHALLRLIQEPALYERLSRNAVALASTITWPAIAEKVAAVVKDAAYGGVH